MSKTEAQEKALRGGMRGWVKLLLVLSLALNLLVIGLAAGAVSRHGPPRGGDKFGAPFGGPYLKAMEHEDRRAVLRAYREAGPARPSRDTLRAEVAQVIAALRAEPYDAETAERIIRDQQGMIHSRARAGQEAMLAHIRAMDAESRRDYAEELQEDLERFGKRDKDGDRDHGKPGKSHHKPFWKHDN